MKLNFTFRHLDRSESLEAHTEQRLDDLQKLLFHHEGFGHVAVSKKDHKFTIEMSINTRIKYFRANASNENAYQAVDDAVDKILKQCLKAKQLVQSHKKKELSKHGRLEKLNNRFELSSRYRKAT